MQTQGLSTALAASFAPVEVTAFGSAEDRLAPTWPGVVNREKLPE